MTHANARAAWTVEDLQADTGWIFELDDTARRDLTAAVRRAADPDKTLFDYRRADFDLGSAWPVIAAALREVRDGTGFAILRRMPRAGISPEAFELLTWGIGLHGQKQGGAQLPEMMRWLWRDYPRSYDPNDQVERSFRGPAAP